MLQSPPLNLFNLHNRVAVVTGFPQGIGRARTTALAEAGADLALLDRNAPGIEATAHTIPQLGCKALPIPGGVTEPDPLPHVVAPIDRAFGRADRAQGARTHPHEQPREPRTSGASGA